MKCVWLAVSAFSAGIVLAQGTSPGQGPGFMLPVGFQNFPPELRKYLVLTDQQVADINRINLEYTAYFTRRQARIGQVEGEIRDLMVADPLDPQGLGIRYAEVEAIRRDLREQEASYRQKAVAVLKDDQRARLRVLEEALKLQPRIQEAQCSNLMPGVGNALGFALSTAVISNEPVIGGTIGGIIPASRVLLCVPRAAPAQPMTP
jgi:hypothetical protein